MLSVSQYHLTGMKTAARHSAGKVLASRVNLEMISRAQKLFLIASFSKPPTFPKRLHYLTLHDP